MFFVNRDEETCRKRCFEIQEILADSMPAVKKFSTIFTLMDQYTDEGSDVNLLIGVKIPKEGPVFLTSKTIVESTPEGRLASQVREPSSSLKEPKPPHEPATSSTEATASPASASRGAMALTSDQAALIDTNKKAALERRALIQAEAQRISRQQIFDNMQWIP